MCTSSHARMWRRNARGFTLMEVMLAMALAAVVVAGVGPLALRLQEAGVREADRSIVVVQGRVAAARFERDLRTASAGGCAFNTSCALLEASPRQVVLVSRSDDGSGSIIVEWEISEGRLMRRWGPCPQSRPEEYLHSLYVDHKTMLEGLGGNAELSYYADGVRMAEGVPTDELTMVEAVVLEASGVDSRGEWPEGIWAGSLVSY